MSETTEVTTGSLTTEKISYRAYVTLDTDKDGKTVIKEIKSQAETDKKDDKGMSANWSKLEAAGYTLFAENEFVKYTVKDEKGFRHLVPTEEQRIYIIQAGLNYIQNAKANKAMTATKDDVAEPTPVSNLETIDLREAINEPPQRKSLTDLEKLEKLLDSLGLSAADKAALLLSKAQAIADTPEAEEEA